MRPILILVGVVAFLAFLSISAPKWSATNIEQQSATTFATEAKSEEIAQLYSEAGALAYAGKDEEVIEIALEIAARTQSVDFLSWFIPNWFGEEGKHEYAVPLALFAQRLGAADWAAENVRVYSAEMSDTKRANMARKAAELEQKYWVIQQELKIEGENGRHQRREGGL